MNALENGLYEALTSDATLVAKLASAASIYAYNAPENAPLPVIVFYQQTGTEDYTLEGRAFSEWLYGVKAITQSQTMKLASEIDETIDALLTDSVLTVDGGVSLFCRRESSIPKYTEITNGVRYNHAGGSYRIWTGE